MTLLLESMYHCILTYCSTYPDVLSSQYYLRSHLLTYCLGGCHVGGCLVVFVAARSQWRRLLCFLVASSSWSRPCSSLSTTVGGAEPSEAAASTPGGARRGLLVLLLLLGAGWLARAARSSSCGVADGAPDEEEKSAAGSK